MAPPRLPIEVWARVARFLPPSERVRAFGSLRAALLIPTHLHAFHTLSLFLAEVAEAERAAAVAASEAAPWPIPVSPDRIDARLVDSLVELGFDHAAALAALVRADANVHVALYELAAGW
jgi:hypothetical protein